ncbi:hypothetical protein FRC00_010873, partial [Tulasnella sp. 408]
NRRADTASAATGIATLETKLELKPIAPLDEVAVELDVEPVEAVAEAAAAEEDDGDAFD